MQRHVLTKSVDLVYYKNMKTMLVSEFKAKCIAALKEIRDTRQPMMVTLRGKPLVIIEPAELRVSRKRLGGLKGRMRIRRDLVKVDSSKDWEMMR